MRTMTEANKTQAFKIALQYLHALKTEREAKKAAR